MTQPTDVFFYDVRSSAKYNNERERELAHMPHAPSKGSTLQEYNGIEIS